MSFWDFSLENTGRTQIVSIQYQEQYGRAKKPVFMRVFAVSSVIPTQFSHRAMQHDTIQRYRVVLAEDIEVPQNAPQPVFSTHKVIHDPQNSPLVAHHISDIDDALQEERRIHEAQMEVLLRDQNMISSELKDEGTAYTSCIITIFYKGIMPSEKILDFPVDCNFLTGSVNL